MRSMTRDVVSVAISKVIIIGAGLGKSIVLARWLGPEMVGVMAALLVYPAIFMSFGSLGVRQATTYVVGKRLFTEDEVKKAIVQLWCVSSVLSLVACYLLVRTVGQAGNVPLLIALAIAPIPFTLFNHYNQGLFLGRNDIQAFNRINWIPPVLVLLATIGLVVVVEGGLAGALTAAIVGPIFMSVLVGHKHDFLRSIRFTANWALIRSLVSLGLVYAFALLVINLNYKVDVILMDRLSTDHQIGIYSTGASLIEYLWQIPMLLSTIIFARSATATDDAQFSRDVLRLLRVSLLAIGAASLVLIVLADWIIVTLFGEAFLPSAKVLVILLPGVLLLTLFKVLNMDLAGKGKPWVSLVAMAPALVVNVVLNVLWVPAHGANGAAAASTVSYSVATVTFVIAYSRVTGIPMLEIVRYRASDLAPLRRLLGHRAATVTR